MLHFCTQLHAAILAIRCFAREGFFSLDVSSLGLARVDVQQQPKSQYNVLGIQSCDIPSQ